MIDIVLMVFVLLGITSYIALFWLYAGLMLLKNKYLEDILAMNDWAKYSILWFPAVLFIIGYIGDILWRIIYGTIIFRVLPSFNKEDSIKRKLNDLTLSHLVGDILEMKTNIKPGSNRWDIAFAICSSLEKYDPGHCGKGFKDIA